MSKKQLLRTLLILLLALAFFGLVFLALRLSLAADQPVERKLGMLLALATFSLLISAAGMKWALAARSGSPIEFGFPSQALLALICAYGLPFLLFTLPDMLAAWTEYYRPVHPLLLPGAGFPWFILWSSLVLLAILMINLPASLRKISPVRLPLSTLVAGGLAGLGCFLTGAFLLQLIGSPDQLARPDLGAPGALIWVVIAACALIINPLAAGWFWRVWMLERAPARLSPSAWLVVTAVLFAAAQLRPLLLLPAFVLGLVCAWLAEQTRSLIPAMIAHAVFNLLMLLLTPTALL